MARLPPYPRGTSTRITLKSSGVRQSPIMGGPERRINRLADRWVLEVEMRSMDARQAAGIINALTTGLRETVIADIQQGFDSSLTGDGTVAAARASGNLITYAGLLKAPEVGQFFSIEHDGKFYLHRVEAVSGKTIAFFPPLKSPVVAGDRLHFVQPKIEGFIDGQEWGWTLSLVSSVGVAFRIEEAN